MTLVTFYESQLPVSCRPPTGGQTALVKRHLFGVAIQFVVSNYSPAQTGRDEDFDLR